MPEPAAHGAEYDAPAALVGAREYLRRGSEARPARQLRRASVLPFPQRGLRPALHTRARLAARLDLQTRLLRQRDAARDEEQHALYDCCRIQSNSTENERMIN